MAYFITFLEGIITFISPCLLPMLPVYITYFAGEEGTGQKSRTFINALGFVVGFTLVFVAMGAFAGTLGQILILYQKQVNWVLGGIVILFGLGFMEIIPLPFFGSKGRRGFIQGRLGFFRALLFGIVFSIGWTPCVSAFLGSALMLAASEGESLKGVLMLLSFSLGLGIPFVASAVLINRLKQAFDFIKRHYRIINLIAGLLLVLMGLLMAMGWMSKILNLSL